MLKSFQNIENRKSVSQASHSELKWVDSCDAAAAVALECQFPID